MLVYEQLIEHLRERGGVDPHCGMGGDDVRIDKSYLRAAADAIQYLSDALYDADGTNLVAYWYQQCQIAENGLKNMNRLCEVHKKQIARLQ